MSIENNVIRAPISIGDVKTALNEDTLNLGSLCTSPNIDPLAKHKPVKFNSFITKENTYKANDGDCGLKLPILKVSTSNLDDLISDYFSALDGSNGWKYVGVEPGKDYCRLSDFNGYAAGNYVLFHCRSEGMSNGNLEIDRGTIEISINISKAFRFETNLSIDDFKSVSDNNLTNVGAFLYGYINGKRYYKRIASPPGALSLTRLHFSTADLVPGTYQICYFLSDTSIGENDADKEITILPIYRLRYTNLVVKDNEELKYNVTIDNFTATLKWGSCQPSITISNKSDIDIEISDLTYYFYPSAQDTDYTSTIEESVFTILKNQSVTKSLNKLWDVGTDNPNPKVEAKFTVAGTEYSKTCFIFINFQ